MYITIKGYSVLVLKVTDVYYTHLILTKDCCLKDTGCLNVDDFGGKLFHINVPM